MNQDAGLLLLLVALMLLLGDAASSSISRASLSRSTAGASPTRRSGSAEVLADGIVVQHGGEVGEDPARRRHQLGVGVVGQVEREDGHDLGHEPAELSRRHGPQNLAQRQEPASPNRQRLLVEVVGHLCGVYGRW